MKNKTLKNEVETALKKLHSQAVEVSEENIVRYVLNENLDPNKRLMIERMEIENCFLAERKDAIAAMIKDKSIKTYEQYVHFINTVTSNFRLRRIKAERASALVKSASDPSLGLNAMQDDLSNDEMSEEKSLEQETDKFEYQNTSHKTNRLFKNSLRTQFETQLAIKLIYEDDVNEKRHIFLKLFNLLSFHLAHQLVLNTNTLEKARDLLRTVFVNLLDKMDNFSIIHDPIFVIQSAVQKRISQSFPTSFTINNLYKHPELVYVYTDFFQKNLVKSCNLCKQPGAEYDYKVFNYISSQKQEKVYYDMHPILREIGESLCLIAGERLKLPFAIYYMILIDGKGAKGMLENFNISLEKDREENIVFYLIYIAKNALDKHLKDIFLYLDNKKSGIYDSKTVSCFERFQSAGLFFCELVSWVYGELNVSRVKSIYRLLSDAHVDDIRSVLYTVEGIIKIKNQKQLSCAEQHEQICNVILDDKLLMRRRRNSRRHRNSRNMQFNLFFA